MNAFASTIEVGEKAPYFSLFDQDGNSHELDDYKGRRLVIYFFPKVHTPGWIKQACGFRDEFETFEEYNISILGVSFDSEVALKSFKNKYDLEFNLLSDLDKNMGNAYGVNRFYFFPSRKTFLINEQGILIHVFDSVNLHSHPLDILEFFKEYNPGVINENINWILRYLKLFAECFQFGRGVKISVVPCRSKIDT